MCHLAEVVFAVGGAVVVPGDKRVVKGVEGVGVRLAQPKIEPFHGHPHLVRLVVVHLLQQLQSYFCLFLEDPRHNKPYFGQKKWSAMCNIIS